MPDGAVLEIYNAANGVLNIYLLESLVIQKQEHPLRGRLTALMIVAVSYFLSYFDDSQGILLCEPPPNLEDYYRSFGFEYVDKDKMFASIERLNEMQSRLNEANRSLTLIENRPKIYYYERKNPHWGGM